MKTLTLAFGGLALFGLTVSATLWYELRAQRELVAEWQRTHPQAASISPASPADAFATSAITPAARAEGADLNPAVSHAAPGISNPLTRERERLKDPEYRGKVLSQLRRLTPQRYPGLVETLGLSSEEADRWFDLLVEQQLELESFQELSPIEGAPRDTTVLRQMVRERQEMQRRQERAQASLLGDARYRKWQEYQETRRAREKVVQQYGIAMTSSGQPLSEPQVQKMTAILVAEERRQRQEIQNLRDNPPPGPVNVAQLVEETARRRTESNALIVDAARPHLSAQQLESLRTTLDEQVAAIRRTVLPHP